jgi:hypothetical protein
MDADELARITGTLVSAVESFFSSLKTERTARKVYRTRTQARADSCPAAHSYF